MTRERRTAIGVSIALAVCVIYRLLPFSWPEDAAMRYGRMCIEQMVLLGIPAVMMRPWRSSRLPVQKRWWVYALFLLASAAVQPVMQGVSDAWMTLTGAGEAAGYPMPVNALETLLMVGALVVLPAVCEEAFFRGAMYCGLVKKLGRGAFWLTAVVFVMLHAQIGQLPFHIGVSLLLTLAMRQTGRLWLPMLMHAVINGIGLMKIIMR